MMIERYKNNPESKHLSGFTLNYLLPAMKIEYPWLKGCSTQGLQQTLKDLSESYQRFFKKSAKFPRFKSKHFSKKSYRVPQAFSLNDNQKSIKLPKLGYISIHTPKKIIGKLKNVTVSKSRTNKYYASILVEEENQTWTKTGNSIGIDLGISTLAILSNGYKYETKHFDKLLSRKKVIWERKLARRRLNAKKEIAKAKHYNNQVLTLEDFNNYQKARVMVAKYSEKIANQRLDYIHKLTTSVVRQFDFISVENIKSKFMLKNHHLSRSASNNAWNILLTQLEYKCNWYGKTLVKVNPAKTSQVCSSCGYDDGKHTLDVRTWTCSQCHTVLDRDINASKNILSKGLALVK